jgi:hypothetical protein
MYPSTIPRRRPRSLWSRTTTNRGFFVYLREPERLFLLLRLIPCPVENGLQPTWPLGRPPKAVRVARNLFPASGARNRDRAEDGRAKLRGRTLLSWVTDEPTKL